MSEIITGQIVEPLTVENTIHVAGQILAGATLLPHSHLYVAGQCDGPLTIAADALLTCTGQLTLGRIHNEGTIALSGQVMGDLNAATEHGGKVTAAAHTLWVSPRGTQYITKDGTAEPLTSPGTLYSRGLDPVAFYDHDTHSWRPISEMP